MPSRANPLRASTDTMRPDVDPGVLLTPRLDVGRERGVPVLLSVVGERYGWSPRHPVQVSGLRRNNSARPDANAIVSSA